MTVTAYCIAGAGSLGIFAAGTLLGLGSLKIKPDMVFAASSGGLNALLLAQGQLEQLEELWLGLSDRVVRSFKPLHLLGHNACLYSFEPLEELLVSVVDENKLKACPFPTWIAVTDLSTNSTIRYGLHESQNTRMLPRNSPSLTGAYGSPLSLVDALVASCSIPALVAPWLDRYVDGGVMADYGLIAAASAGARRIIMIHPGPPPFYYRDGRTTFSNIVDPIDMAFQLLMWGQYQLEKQALIKLKLQYPVELIEIMPEQSLDFGVFDFNYKDVDRAAIIQQGRDAATKALGSGSDEEKNKS